LKGVNEFVFLDQSVNDFTNLLSISTCKPHKENHNLTVWCRLETSLLNVESENQVLRQQSLLASADEVKSKHIEG
jgi:hypothetical protein